MSFIVVFDLRGLYRCEQSEASSLTEAFRLPLGAQGWTWDLRTLHSRFINTHAGQEKEFCRKVINFMVFAVVFASNALSKLCVNNCKYCILSHLHHLKRLNQPWPRDGFGFILFGSIESIKLKRCLLSKLLTVITLANDQ